MKKIYFFFLIAAAALLKPAAAQEQIDSIKFFEEQSVINLTLETDLKDLLGKRQNERFIPATVTMAFENGTNITEQIKLSVRGIFRKENCFMPGLRLDFHNPTSPRLYKLDKLKLVCGCSQGAANEQLVLREYIAYKVFNQLTELSFRVRLVNITFKDASGKRKPYTQHGFFIEDVDMMAKRNGMKEFENPITTQEITNRDQITLVSIFQYFLGNTDWSVPNYHNVKLIIRDGENERPYAVPYDFDICGFVDPPYATIDERFQIETVRERLYRGFARPMEDLQKIVKLYNEKKDAIYNLYNSFTLLDSKSKSWLIKFTDDFYKTINDARSVQRIFIDETRPN